jgi:hypothetical protein
MAEQMVALRMRRDTLTAVSDERTITVGDDASLVVSGQLQI